VNEYREWLRLKAVSSDAAFAEYVNGRQPLRLRVFRGSARRGAPSMAHGDATPPTATNGCLRRARSQARPDQGELAGSHNGSRRPPPDPPEGWMRRRVRRDALCGLMGPHLGDSLGARWSHNQAHEGLRSAAEPRHYDLIVAIRTPRLVGSGRPTDSMSDSAALHGSKGRSARRRPARLVGRGCVDGRWRRLRRRPDHRGSQRGLSECHGLGKPAGDV